MSLTQALATAVAGLRANQMNLSVVAANVANADTPGYTRKTPIQLTTATGRGVSVRVAGVNRELDQYIQRQLRVETAGASYADQRATFYNRLQSIYGVPGSDSALSTIFDGFTSSLQALATSPESPATRTAVITSAQVLAQQLNSMTTDIQALRSDAEHGLQDAVTRANEAMDRIAAINRQLGTSAESDNTAATLQDDRDRYIDELSQLMDIVVVPTDHNQVTVFTNSGIQLVGIQPGKITFDAQGAVTPQAQWSADGSVSTLGTLKLMGPNGGDVDLISSRSIRSGAIAAYLDMRDHVLVEAQTQLDALAATMASALSDHEVDGVAVNAGAQAGFDIDTASLAAGNTIHLTYTDVGNNQHSISILRVDDPSALPLSDAATGDPNDRVVGIDFSGGMASVVSQLNAALGSVGLQFASPGGTTLRALDDGALNQASVDGLSATVTATALADGDVELPFFVDASRAYTGAITGGGTQRLGFAGRITVNAALVADPSKLVVFDSATATGDATRPSFILDRLTDTSFTYTPQSGIGSSAAPYSASLPDFVRQVISQQGDAASAADSLAQGQGVVLQSLQARFDSDTAVNVDVEMATLLSLQNSYAANARVLSTVREMLDALIQM